MIKIISEKNIRKTLSNLLKESSPAVATALTALEVHKNSFDNLKTEYSDATQARGSCHELIRGKVPGSSIVPLNPKLVAFEIDFIAYVNAFDGGTRLPKGGSDNIVIFKNLVQAINGTLNMPLTSRDERKQINTKVAEACEGGTGFGTDEAKIELALIGGEGVPKIAQIIDMQILDAEFASDARKRTTFGRTRTGGMYETLCNTATGELEKTEMVDYVINPLINYSPIILFKNSEKEEVPVEIDKIYQTFIDNVPANLKRKGGVGSGSGKKGAGAGASGSTTTTTTTTTTGGGGAGGSAFSAGKGEIKMVDKITPVIPKGFSGTVPKLSQIINIPNFKSDLVKRIRGDSRSIPSQQVYELEVSFKKGTPDELNMNLSPVGVHRVVLRGKLGGKFKKGSFWDGSIKEIFATAFNDNIYTGLASSGIDRFKFRVVFDAGYYDASMYDPSPMEESKKILIKGKDILNIISPLKLRK